MRDKNDWRHIATIFAGIEIPSEYAIKLGELDFANNNLEIRFSFEADEYEIKDAYLSKTFGYPKKEFISLKLFNDPLSVKPFSKKSVVINIPKILNKNFDINYVVEILGYYKNMS